MNISIIRHGQTDWNSKQLFQGRSNVLLNSTGIEQAKKLSLSLKNEPIDLIYVSPLQRAIQTAEIINECHQTPIIVDDLIIERGLGILEGKKMSDYNLAELWEHILNLSNKTDTIYQVETLESIIKRAFTFLSKVLLEYQNTDKNIYIVAHGSINLILLLLLGQVDTSKPLQEFRIENCHCYTIHNPTLKHF